MWNDKAPIYFLATKYVSDADTTVLRYDAKEHKRMPVTCPAMAKAYNMYLGGTDKNDQLTKLQWCRRHYKWPRRLTVKFFVWNVFYGYVIQNLYKPRIIPGKRIQTFRMFIDELCHNLVGLRRRALVPMSRCTSAGDEAWLHNEPNISLHLYYQSEWKEQLKTTDVFCVQRSTSCPKK